MHRFKQITQCNGFDCKDPNNAKQNSYAWSIAELGEYIYVGTGRNILLIALESGAIGDLPIPIPSVFLPEQLDLRGEIWRYKKDGTKNWERVFKATRESQIIGFRVMTKYTTPSGETALYAIAFTLNNKLIMLKSNDGICWRPVNTKSINGSSARSMIVHKGRLYMGVLPANEITTQRTLLYSSSDPERNGWQFTDLNGDPKKNPRGNIIDMVSFENQLYVATSRIGGFEVWRTTKIKPSKDQWKLIVDKGAGDAFNQVPLSMTVFKNCIYVGTAIYFALAGLGKEPNILPPKGFDLIRINRKDKWDLVIGSAPISPTKPTTGVRKRSLSGYSSGFRNLTNGYCWQLQPYKNELYLGTFDWSNTIPPFINELQDSIPLTDEPINNDNLLKAWSIYLGFLCPTLLLPGSSFLKSTLNCLSNGFNKNMGFDLWKTRDGIHWSRVTRNGLGSQTNYGARTLFVSSENKLYLGTSNPFKGCEVWVKE